METESMTALVSLLFIVIGLVFMAITSGFAAVTGIAISVIGIIIFAAILISYGKDRKKVRVMRHPDSVAPQESKKV